MCRAWCGALESSFCLFPRLTKSLRTKEVADCCRDKNKIENWLQTGPLGSLSSSLHFCDPDTASVFAH